jgi:Protein of unknown function (DUF1553)/Protein of unknown function (DUF1549)/Planctomycete cytochrome C
MHLDRPWGRLRGTRWHNLGRRALFAAVLGIVFLAGCTGTIGDRPATGECPPTSTTTTGNAGDTGHASDDIPVDFFVDIQPILGDYCVRCHGGVRELGSPALNLQSRKRAARVLGCAGDVTTSQLYLRVTSNDPNVRMPLGGQPLPEDKIEKLRRWIDQGAPWPQHWSFAPVQDVDPSAMAVGNEAWIRSPIDRFILRRLEKEGLAPSPEADAPTLLRRVTMDLTGLPPTPAEFDAFVADVSPQAYEKVVDRLLASPSFGEMWARHWLDQARYADSDGYQTDAARPGAWRWRDWVVDSINADQPFDRFTVEQIAGDLLPGATPMQVLATGFHRQSLWNRELGVDGEEDRTHRIIDRAATVGETWLGLTLGCTQCHSHPYDPISQREFYQLYAFFNNTDEAAAQVPADADHPETLVADEVMAERTTDLRANYLFVRGDFLNPDKTAELVPGTPAVLHPFAARGARPDRLDLANWLVDAKNPLTPRVTVNTIWYHLFGQGIVSSLDDFGSRASLPSHPELLDWLAHDFVAEGWRRKRLIKEIVMSATYRQAAAFRTDSMAGDPQNTLLSRQNRVRIAAEAVTDSYLGASGLLTSKVGGPCVYPPIPPEVLTLTFGGTDWPTSTGPDRYRRALYTFHKRTAPHPNLQVFDRPAADVSVTGRGRSDTPLQALTTMHDVVFVEAAQALAKRVQSEKPGSLAEQITLAFRLAVTRAPTDEELAVLVALHDDSKAGYDASPDDAVKAVGDYLPDGVEAAEAAAWVVTARVILNLDEVLTVE